MSYEITIPGCDFTGKMYGLTWTNGTAHTEDGFTAGRLRCNGYIVKAVRVTKKK